MSEAAAPRPSRRACCPGCGCIGDFAFLGIQTFPPHVAARIGVDPQLPLWTCPHCESTISEPSLRDPHECL